MRREFWAFLRYAGPPTASYALDAAVEIIALTYIAKIGERELAAAGLAFMLSNMTGHAVYTGMSTALGTVGRLEALRRTESGKFRIEEAVSVEELRAAHRGEDQAPPLIPVADALRTLPELTLSRQEYREIAGRGSVPRSLMGRQLPELAGGEELTNGDEELEVKLLAPNGALAAIGGARNGRIERVVTFFR